jgi:hypothetical protein
MLQDRPTKSRKRDGKAIDAQCGGALDNQGNPRRVATKVPLTTEEKKAAKAAYTHNHPSVCVARGHNDWHANNRERHSLPKKFGVYIDELIVVDRATRGNADAAAPAAAAPAAQDTSVSQAATDKAQAEHNKRSTKNKRISCKCPCPCSHTSLCFECAASRSSVCTLLAANHLAAGTDERERECATWFTHGMAAHTVAVL